MLSIPCSYILDGRNTSYFCLNVLVIDLRERMGQWLGGRDEGREGEEEGRERFIVSLYTFIG